MGDERAAADAGRGGLPSEPATYQVGRLREALASDPRVGEQSLSIAVVADRVVVDGEVADEDVRAAIDAVVAELLPGVQVANQVTVSSVGGPPEPERLR